MAALPGAPPDPPGDPPALQALLAAINGMGQPDLVAQAFSPEAIVEVRYQDPNLQPATLRGLEEIRTWMAAPRGVCRFFAQQWEVMSQQEEQCVLQVRYGYHHAQYTAWGWWTIEATGPRIDRLLHAPDRLPRTPREWWEQHGIRVAHFPPEELIFAPTDEIAAPDDPASAGHDPA